MHASCESPWHPIAKRCVLDTCFLLTSPFRGMLLTPRGGPRCLAPTAHRVPVYPMVSITFLCRACTAQPIPPLDPYVRLSPHTAHERGTFTGSFHFANSTDFTVVSLRVRWLPLYRFPTLSLRAFAMCAVFPRSDYYAQFDCL